MKIDPSNDLLVGPDGAHYPNRVQAFYYGKLNFCGCGNPEDAMTFLRDVLAAKALEDFNEARAAEAKLLPLESPLALSYRYWLDAIELTEHGSSIYGAWLTEYGSSVLKMLQEEDVEAAMM